MTYMYNKHVERERMTYVLSENNEINGFNYNSYKRKYLLNRNIGKMLCDLSRIILGHS